LIRRAITVSLVEILCFLLTRAHPTPLTHKTRSKFRNS